MQIALQWSKSRCLNDPFFHCMGKISGCQHLQMKKPLCRNCRSCTKEFRRELALLDLCALMAVIISLLFVGATGIRTLRWIAISSTRCTTSPYAQPPHLLIIVNEKPTVNVPNRAIERLMNTCKFFRVAAPIPYRCPKHHHSR